jgi:3',5'-cyclic-AMP phosphodiesterase
MIRVLQLSDTHLLQQANALLYRQDVDKNLAMTLDVARSCGPFDLVALTGDISQDGSAASYQRVLDMLQVIDYQHLRAIPGNGLSLGAWHFCPLNSFQQDCVEGHLKRDELDALSGLIDDVEGGAGDVRFLMIAVHHPPHYLCQAAHCSLFEPEPLLTLAARPAVRLVMSGHVHDDYAHRLGTTMFSTSPSTCIGFDHDPAGHKASTLTAGAVIYELADDGSVGRRAIYTAQH